MMLEWKKRFRGYAPYFEDLFRRIYILTISFIVLFIIGFFLSPSIIKALTHFFNFKDVSLSTTAPFQLFDLLMDVSIAFAATLSVPLLLYHFYAFVGSGLRYSEKRFFFFTLPLGLGLFLFGFAYSFGILYFTMQTLADINISLGVINLWNISVFLSQILSTSILLGLIFEFPIIMTFLVKLNLLKISFLRQKRRYAIFVMVVLTSLLPPTDGISLLMMVLPLVLLYEGTIIYNGFRYRELL